MKTLFREEGSWYKGNLHLHTSRSDGEVSVTEAVEIYRQAGYDFLAVTDHRVPGCTIEPHQSGTYEDTRLEAGEMLLLAGVEWDTGGRNTRRPGDLPCWHILGIGMDQEEDGRFADILHPRPQEIVDHIHEQGGLAILAHPAWSVMEPSALQEVDGLDGAEIINTVSGRPWNSARGDASYYFDLWATWQKRFLTAYGGDDAHHYQGDAGVSFTMVRARSLSRDDILFALAAGQCYASQGPRIRQILYDPESRLLSVECSEDVTHAEFSSNRIYDRGRYQTVQNGQVSYRLNPYDDYVRITLIDEQGRQAWSSPLTF